jgi:hypothetical protein
MFAWIQYRYFFNFLIVVVPAEFHHGNCAGTGVVRVLPGEPLYADILDYL